MDELSGGRVSAIKAAVAAQVPPGARVVEIGCGTGELAERLCERGARVTAFDPNPAMLAVARQRSELGGLGDQLALREMGVEGMDALPPAAFDVVVATLVLSELSDDERRYALSQAARILQPRGLLVIADEVVPRRAAARAVHGVVRSTQLLGTYLVSGSITLPLARLPAELREQGFAVEREQRSHGGAFAIVVAHRSAAPPRDPSSGADR